MPNWCEGVLKVRGPIENIKKFLFEGTDYNDYKYIPHLNEKGILVLEETAIPREGVIQKIDENGVYITNTEELYIKDTRRMFIASDDIGSNVIRRDNTALIFIDVKQAWGFIANDLARISQKYGVDFRIFATESGMEFCQEIEVLQGEITIDRIIPYNDFNWEAPDPRIGG